MIHANSDANYRPALDRVDGIQFAKRLLVWAGVAWIAVAVKLSRSLLDMLTEASAGGLAIAVQGDVSTKERGPLRTSVTRSAWPHPRVGDNTLM